MDNDDSKLVMQDVSAASTGAGAAIAGGKLVGVDATMVNASIPTAAIAVVEGMPLIGGVGSVVAGGIATAVTVAAPVAAAVGGAKNFFSWLTN